MSTMLGPEVDVPLCAYCGHPHVHHHQGRCYTERRTVGGAWDDCTCKQYQAEEEP